MALGSDWATQVLMQLNLKGAKVPFTKANIDFLEKWQAREGGGTNNTANFNPLNTTLGSTASGVSIPGSTTIGGAGGKAGVQAYPDAQTGYAATASTLTESRYDKILAALQSGNPFAYQAKNADTFGPQLSAWSGGSYNSISSITVSSDGHTITGTDASGKTITGKDSTQGGPGGISSATPVIGSVLSVATSIPDFLGKLTNPNYLLRGLQILGGAILAFAGLFLLARQVALASGGIPGPIGKVAEAVA